MKALFLHVLLLLRWRVWLLVRLLSEILGHESLSLLSVHFPGLMLIHPTFSIQTLLFSILLSATLRELKEVLLLSVLLARFFLLVDFLGVNSIIKH